MRRLIIAVACLAVGLLLQACPAHAWIYNEREAPVRAAIIEAITARMGSAVQVTIGTLQIRQAGNASWVAPIAAVPDAGARTGGFIRFVLYDGRAARLAASGAAARPTGRRVGTVDAEVYVSTEQVKARRAIPPGAILTADDLEASREDVGRLPLRIVPNPKLAIGARALRPIAEGELIAATMIVPPTLVKSGDEVQTIVRVGSLEAHGVAIATQTGSLGEEIRLVNASSRRPLRGRVVGTREVEVMYEH
jgi:flagella basal body P-ring formation protein FlgA